MMFVLSLNASKRRLPLRKHHSLMLFVCASGCETFEPFGGSNAAILASRSAPKSRAPRGLGGQANAMKLRKLRYAPARPPAEGEIPNKVGGAPDWLQADETPQCRDCKRRMRFVSQLDESLDAKLNFASGYGYLFVCVEEHDARFLWQS